VPDLNDVKFTIPDQILQLDIKAMEVHCMILTLTVYDELSVFP